jgi:hypothetical protein
MAADLKAFAKHAKRQAVSCDDVKLLVRKMPELKAELEHFEVNTLGRSDRQGTTPPRPSGGGGGVTGGGGGDGAALSACSMYDANISANRFFVCVSISCVSLFASERIKANTGKRPQSSKISSNGNSRCVILTFLATAGSLPNRYERLY